MRKIVMIVFLTTFLTNAQSNLSQEQFEKVVDNMTCLCINEALDKSTLDCEKTTIKESNIPTTDTKTLDLYKEFQKLKKTTDSKELSIIFLTKNVFQSSKYEKIKAFAEKRKGDKINDIIKKIREKITLISSENTKSSDNVSQTSDQSDQFQNSESTPQAEQVIPNVYTDNIEPETKKQKYDTGDFMKDYGFSFILFIMIVGLYIYLRRRNFASVKKVEFMIKVNEGKRKLNPISVPPISSHSPNRGLEDSVNTLKDTIGRLEVKIIALETQSKKEALVPTISVTEVPKTPIMLQDDKIFYKHAPHESGYFDTDDEVNLGDAVFKFTIYNNNSNLASFEIIKEKKKLILDYPNKYIKPVCEELNAFNQNANNLVIHSGIAEKRNDKWVVTSKAKIKYE
ncbi:hypothetical protein RCH18_001983 [Flavobacterium sp. PL11]|uniref:hypothetical protein n=1 Tax=Flavobacterium sp. PL11 TaxID=3071717 RepID=UPI002E0C04F9|nr:hypothetical protein [Flavobacterium sp. PL11]